MPPRATCSFEISFSPTAVGPAEAFATITDHAPGSPHVLSVLGIGGGALAMLSSTSLSFGNQPQGSISASKAVALFNQGNQPLTVTNLAPPAQMRINSRFNPIIAIQTPSQAELRAPSMSSSRRRAPPPIKPKSTSSTTPAASPQPSR